MKSTPVHPYTKFVLTYASTGLGHLRVTNALFDAAPPSVKPVLLRSKSHFASYLHRFTSSSAWFIRLLEWTQYGAPEYILTRLHNALAHLGSKTLFDELHTLVEEDFNVTKRLVLVCTHFGLAHEISALKEKLARSLGCEVFLVVVVTDASPQKVWVVSKADLTIVPSLKTGQVLSMYAQSRGWNFLYEVVSYPLNPRITNTLTLQKYNERLLQLDPKSNSKVHILIPVSGAAASISYYQNLILSLQKYSNRFFFYIVAREDIYTSSFLNFFKGNKSVSLVTSKSSREIVKFYNSLLDSSVFSIEIVKPSEQSFKALLPTNTVGGMILLFSEPVGRQERDNLDFLRGHGLIPSRALELNLDPDVSAKMIFEKLRSGELLSMLRSGKYVNRKGSPELSPDGASKLWNILKKKYI